MEKLRHIIPLFVLALAVVVTLILPFDVLKWGFMPLDDGLRHVAKVVSGKDWSQIVILRDGIPRDIHAGYHTFLSFIYNLTGRDKAALLSASIAVLFLLFTLPPLFFTRRPESWLAALFLVCLADFSFIVRLFTGRPYLLGMVLLVFVCFNWKSFNRPRPYFFMFITTLLLAFAIWCHGRWYLPFIIVLGLVLARQWRSAKLLSVCIVAATILAALLSGHPIDYFSQGLKALMVTVFNDSSLPKMMVSELQPMDPGGISIIVLVALLLFWRHSSGRWDIKRIDDPVFYILITGWILGFFMARFWSDFGMPALLVWMALEFDSAFSASIKADSVLRLFLVGALSLLVYKGIFNNTNSRWSNYPFAEYFHQKPDKQLALMPEPGGIIYSDNMSVFFVTFYKYPWGPWRYMVGFEPSFMPVDDLRVFINITGSHGSHESFLPWIKKMTPKDRLIVTSRGIQPQIPELDWQYAGSNFWVGKVKDNKAGSLHNPVPIKG